MPFLLVFIVVLFVRLSQSNARREEAEKRAAWERAKRWDAASESEREAILAATKINQENAAAGIPKYKRGMTVQAKDLAESQRLWAIARDYDNHPKDLKAVVFSPH